jgi:hypothetical protein
VTSDLTNEGARDRDEDGRARNARPRDGLGRPLPYGSANVDRAPEGIVRKPQDSLAQAQALLDQRMPFHAHEILEDAWKSAPEPERELWRGLAQLAVGYTHLLRGNPAGAVTLLRRGATALADYETTQPYGIDVPGLIAWATTLADVGGTEAPSTGPQLGRPQTDAATGVCVPSPGLSAPEA